MYRNIAYNPKRGTIWYSDWDKNGFRTDHEVPYRPYLYLKDSTGIDAISIYEEPLKKYEFDNTWERKEFCASTKKTYFNLPPEQQFLIDRFWMYPQDEKFSQFPLKVWFIDIEVFCADGFPNAIEARWPINVLTIFDYTEKKYHIFTTAEQYYPKEKNAVVHLYPGDEFAMIKGFVKFWRSDFPDIVSGWYSWGYDIPYICNRMAILYNNEDAPSKLSPVGRTYKRDNAKIRLGAEEKTYEQLWTICGVSSIDLQAAYLKFARVKLASYSLNYVCDHENVGQKLEHDGSLSDWWITDPQEFIDYNVQDVALLVKLEDKLRFMELCRAVAYSGLCPLEQSLKTLSTIGGLAAIEAMHKNRIISSFDTSDAKVNYEGGFVSEPVPGFHNNILSIDANSMYPNALISFNMSNETKVGNVLPNGKGGYILTTVSGRTKEVTKDDLYRIMREKQVACTPNGILFSQKKEGIMPAVVSRIYNTRKAAKKEMLAIEKELVGMPDSPEKEEKRRKAEFLNLRQYLMKININSLYGALCEKHFVLFDIDIGASITTVGRTVIKSAQRFLDEFASDYCGKEVKTEVYGDTDSRYFTITELMERDNQPFLMPDGEINPWVFEKSKQMEDFVNRKTTEMLKDRYGCTNPTLSFKTESVAPTGLWTAKKRYIVYCRSDEGVPCDEFHYTGIDIKRSTCPKKIRPLITKVAEQMLKTQDRNVVASLLDETYKEYVKLPFDEKVVSMGCNNISEYTQRGLGTQNGIALHTPRQVACGIQWNNMLKRDGLVGKYSLIHDSEKIRLFYCHDNGDGITSFGFKDRMPEEYRDKYVFDDDVMYKKSVLACLEKLFEAVGWELPDPTKGEEDLLGLIG